jgi:hypothetical protein
MKKLSFIYSLMAALMLSVAFVACSSDDDNNSSPKKEMTTGITYKSRNYTHAWLSDNTLLLISTDGEHKKVIWTKLNAENMSIIDQGILNINVAEGFNVLTTSGVATYRKSDNKVFYFYYNKQETSGSSKTTNEPFFRIAVINPETMAVEKETINVEAAQCTASAYGELLQSTIFFDENDNLYLSAFTGKAGKLLRIKNGEYDFEAGYNALPGAKGKLLTVQYMGGNKAFAYIGDGSGTSIDSFAYFYAIIDLNSKTVSRVQYNGTDLPVSGGSFSQRSAFNNVEKKMYFAVDPKDSNPQIYIYDAISGAVTAGAKVAEGYYFEQIRFFDRPSAHYDLTVCTEKHGGMNRDKSHIMLSMSSLSDSNVTIDFKGQGSEITDYTMESIYDGQFMYQVPNSNDRYSKLQFKDNKIQVIREQKFI